MDCVEMGGGDENGLEYRNSSSLCFFFCSMSPVDFSVTRRLYSMSLLESEVDDSAKIALAQRSVPERQ